jgi:enediyne biosynthesis protein E4
VRKRPTTTIQNPAPAVVVLTLLAGCSPEPGDSPTPDPRQEVAVSADPWFEEVAAPSGITFEYQTGHSGRYLMPEIKGGGVGLLDFDGDGLLDIFCVQAGALDPSNTLRPTHRLFRNLGNWQFEDVTESAGVGGDGRYGMGCACADFDGDGHVDIHITHVQGSLLYRNNGDGTFSDVTDRAGLTNVAWGVGSAFFDLDGDSHLDLFIANYLRWTIAGEVDCFSRGGMPDYCSPLSYSAPAMDTLYRNRGDGTFENVSIQAGLDKAYGNGLGVVAADFDRDGRFDIFVANDASPNQLWMNQGSLPLVDQALIRGCAVNALGMSEAGMGITSVDLDNNGWRDLFITHLVGEANRLFMNTNGRFLDVVEPEGPGIPSWPYTSFGVGFFDFDHDGVLDLFVANGRVKRADQDLDPTNPYAEPNSLLKGLDNARFQEVHNAGMAMPLIASSRGAAFGDLDNDGDIDIVVVNRDGPIHLLRNIAPKLGHWTSLRILDEFDRDAIGAEVRIRAGDKTYWRAVTPHESYASSNDPRIHCGLGPIARVAQVEVTWPDGHIQLFENIPADRFYEVRRDGMTPTN